MKFFYCRDHQPISRLCLAFCLTLMTAPLHNSSASHGTETTEEAVSHQKNSLSTLPTELVDHLERMSDKQLKEVVWQTERRRSNRLGARQKDHLSSSTFNRGNALETLMNSEEYTEQDIFPLFPIVGYAVRLAKDYREFLTGEEACSKLEELKQSGKPLPSSVAIIEPLKPETATALYDTIRNLEQFFFSYSSDTTEQILSISEALKGVQVAAKAGFEDNYLGCFYLGCFKKPLLGDGDDTYDLGLELRFDRTHDLLLAGKYDQAKKLIDSLVGTSLEQNIPRLGYMLYLDPQRENPYYDMEKGRACVKQIRESSQEEPDHYYNCLAMISERGLSVRKDGLLASSYREEILSIMSPESKFAEEGYENLELPPIPSFLSRQEMLATATE